MSTEWICDQSKLDDINNKNVHASPLVNICSYNIRRQFMKICSASVVRSIMIAIVWVIRITQFWYSFMCGAVFGTRMETNSLIIVWHALNIWSSSTIAFCCSSSTEVSKRSSRSLFSCGSIVKGGVFCACFCTQAKYSTALTKTLITFYRLNICVKILCF